MAEETASTENSLATAAMVLGIVGAALLWVPFLNLILGTLAIVFGAIAMRRDTKRGQAIAGLVLGIIPFAVFWAFTFAIIGSAT